ncbi:MAG: hypothetical protein LBM12_02560 [Candidatus Nomurabacteria bacterium]|jgi:acetate kinase|nr:hypothetical protein [Candidatus Nomurabacteria bacterium]
MAIQNAILVLNPGSSSRKYAYYADGVEVLTLHFEPEAVDGKREFVCTTEKNGEKFKKTVKMREIGEAIGLVSEILRENGVEIDTDADEKGVQVESDFLLAVRIVAPTDYFAENHLVDDEFMENLAGVAEIAPLHVPVVLEEIKDARKIFSGARIIAISDSRFHRTQPETQEYYTISRAVANEFGVKRFGFHGISVSAAVRKLEGEKLLKPKTVICHLGSGASITAVKDGQSQGNSMGVTPLDGIMMATRCGTIDPSALLVLQRSLGLNSLEFEKYLNKECGFRGVFGDDDMRNVERAAREGDSEAVFALALFTQKIVEGVARAAAILGGIDALVFTATIGERGTEARENVVKGLEFLGFELDAEKNSLGLDGKQVANVAAGRKPIYIVKTNEATEIALQASLL